MLVTRSAAFTCSPQHNLCPLAIYLGQGEEGDALGEGLTAVNSILNFKNKERGVLWLWANLEELKKFILLHADLIQEPGADGSSFAICGNRYFYKGKVIANYTIGLTIQSAPDFLDALHFVALEGRLGQFPWVKKVLPYQTYQKLDGLPFQLACPKSLQAQKTPNP